LNGSTAAGMHINSVLKTVKVFNIPGK